jgi:hypothetical protein
MGMVDRELDRIAVALRQTPSGPRYEELYAAQQALSWATDPYTFASPGDFLGAPKDSTELQPTP